MNRKACIYCRVSTTDQNNDRQESDLFAFAKNNNYEIIQVFKEKISGTKSSRPERDKLLKLAKKGTFRFILVTEITRWGRNTIDSIQTMSLLAQHDISVIAQNGLNLNFGTADGRFVGTILSAVAELDREYRNQNIKSGLEEARRKGKIFGRAARPSLKTKKLTPKILELASKNFSARQIGKQLKIDFRTVKRVLENPSLYR